LSPDEGAIPIGFVDARIAGEKSDFKDWETNHPYFRMLPAGPK